MENDKIKQDNRAMDLSGVITPDLIFLKKTFNNLYHSLLKANLKLTPSSCSISREPLNCMVRV